MISREGVSTRTARGYRATLREHLSWLEERIEAKRAEGRPTGYEESRVAALTWAVEVCELEWDAILQRQQYR